MKNYSNKINFSSKDKLILYLTDVSLNNYFIDNQFMRDL